MSKRKKYFFGQVVDNADGSVTNHNRISVSLEIFWYYRDYIVLKRTLRVKKVKSADIIYIVWLRELSCHV